VDQSPEPIATLDAKRGKVTLGLGWERRCLVQCPVRPVGVESAPRLGKVPTAPPNSWNGAAEPSGPRWVDGYRWSRLPGTDVEVRALTDKPLALRYRPSRRS
jgi:hypothetical protein